MNIFPGFSSYSLSSNVSFLFQEKLALSLVVPQKKIALIFSVVLAGIIACCLIRHYCLKSQRITPLNESSTNPPAPAPVPADDMSDPLKQMIQNVLKSIPKFKKTLNGVVYQGKFRNNMLFGEGRISYPNGMCYEGFFKDGKLNGLGRIILSDKTICEGVFIDDLLNGKGRIIFPDGEIQEGLFENDCLCGLGKITLPNGTTLAGLFEGDTFIK